MPVEFGWEALRWRSWANATGAAQCPCVGASDVTPMQQCCIGTTWVFQLHPKLTRPMVCMKQLHGFGCSALVSVAIHVIVPIYKLCPMKLKAFRQHVVAHQFVANPLFLRGQVCRTK